MDILVSVSTRCLNRWETDIICLQINSKMKVKFVLSRRIYEIVKFFNKYYLNVITIVLVLLVVISF